MAAMAMIDPTTPATRIAEARYSVFTNTPGLMIRSMAAARNRETKRSPHYLDLAGSNQASEAANPIL
jgi:hypothetical protein